MEESSQEMTTEGAFTFCECGRSWYTRLFGWWVADNWGQDIRPAGDYCYMECPGCGQDLTRPPDGARGADAQGAEGKDGAG